MQDKLTSTMRLYYLFGILGVVLADTDTECSFSSDSGDGHCQRQTPEAVCDYILEPLTEVFGAKVTNVDLSTIDRKCAERLKQEAFMYRFLLFKKQELHWEKQIRFTELLGTPFVETSSINRKRHAKVPDERLGYFSNDPEEGLHGQGTEGWHVDGNVVQIPHLFTLIYCVSASRNGPTLVVPLKEIVDSLSKEEHELLSTIYFVSGHNSSIVHPLIYKNPVRNDNTILLALNQLSGQYLQQQEDGKTRTMSVEETQFIQDILLAKVLGSNLIFSHQYEDNDLLLLNNPSVAHIAGPGSQTSKEISGLRLMHRSTVVGTRVPSTKTDIRYECASMAPFDNGYCLFSLRNSVYYPRYGKFDTQSIARKRCQNINPMADLAVIPSEAWNDLAKKIITETGVPHWLNATNPAGTEVTWEGSRGDYTNWDPTSKQPNDCDCVEECVIMGPFGYWFDFYCGPKTFEGADPGPEMTWENGERTKYNVFPMCGVPMEFLHLS